MSTEIQNNNVNAQMAASLAAEAGESTEAVTERVEQASADQSSALAQMLAQAEQSASVAKATGVKKTPAKAGDKEPRRRNSEITTRDIHVMKSETLKLAVIMTHVNYINKTSEQRIEMFRKATSKQKRVAEINAADDLTFDTVQSDIPLGNELDLAKVELHEQLVADGWKVVSNKPKLKDQPAAAPVVEEPASEDVAEPEAAADVQAEA